MAQLPFVVAPRVKPETIQIGNEEIGVLAIERKGFVTAGEKSFVSQHSEDKATGKVLELCRKISAEYKIGIETAYEYVGNLLTGQETEDLSEDLGQRIQKKYSSSLRDIFSCMTEEQEKRKLIQAFSMILYRIDSSCEADDFFGLHPDLIEALSNHYEAEESHTSANVDQVTKKEDRDNLTAVEVAEKK